MNTKVIKLRSFEVTNQSIASSQNTLFDLIIDAIERKATISDRLMVLNQDSTQSYVLAYSEISSNRNAIFGLIFDVIPYEHGGELSKELLTEKSIKLSQVTQSKENSLLCKDHFYFYLTPDFLVANCKRSSIISKLQTYLNWLVDDVRDNALMSFTPLIETVNLVRPNEVRSMEIGNVNIPVSSDTGIKTLDVKKWLSSIFSEVPELEQLRQNEILHAFLTLKFKKPNKMSIEEYSSLIGNFAKTIETSDDLKITNKQGRTIKGSKLEKFVTKTINCTIDGLIIEQDLKQAMQSYIQQLIDETKK